MSFLQLLITVLLIAGATVMLLAAIGLHRFGDTFLRMHAATKSSTLGVGCIMIAVALYFDDPLITAKVITLGVIYFFTAPTGAQVLSNAIHIARFPVVRETWVDALRKSRDNWPSAESPVAPAKTDEQAAT